MDTRLEEDVAIQRDVLDELDWDPEVDSVEVGVEVDGGIVTLTGSVTSLAKKLAAERAAQRVFGVRAVANDLVVRPLWSAERTDTDIARAVANRFEWSDSVPEDDIEIVASDGEVTLSGSVDWNYQRTEAERLAHDVTGVTHIINLIRVRPQPPIDGYEIEEKIEKAFKRHAEIDAERIEVEIRGDTVVLRGSVSSWFEREEAERAAWGPGVNEVDNQIRVMP